MKKKVLLWGCISSPWTKSFILEFLLKYNYEVWLLRTSITDEDSSFFEEKGINIIQSHPTVTEWFESGREGSPLKTIYVYFLQIKTVIQTGKYDIIHLQFVEWFELILVSILKIFIGAKLILSYWGSDLLRIDEKILKRSGGFVRYSDYVSFDNEDLKIKFSSIYTWSDNVKNETILFGLPILKTIAERRGISKAKIREKFDFPTEKKIIAIGYNGRAEQQHINVLEVFKKLDNVVKEKVFLVLHMSYGGTEQYKKTVSDIAQETGCDFAIIERFLSEEEVADLRLVTDIFINAQTTDAFSGSVCENMFADSLIINAAWLRYKEFDMYNFKFLEFDKFENLDKCILEGLEYEMALSENRELIWKLRSWEFCSKNWERVYREVLDS